MKNSQYERVFIDTEVFNNYFSIQVKADEPDAPVKVYSITPTSTVKQINAVMGLLEDLSRGYVLIGHNIKGYDNVVITHLLHFLLEGERAPDILTKLKAISDNIIKGNKQRANKDTDIFNIFDTIEYFGFGVGLKELAVRNRTQSIQEFSFTDVLNLDDTTKMNQFIKYSKNDVVMLYDMFYADVPAGELNLLDEYNGKILMLDYLKLSIKTIRSTKSSLGLRMVVDYSKKEKADYVWRLPNNLRGFKFHNKQIADLYEDLKDKQLDLREEKLNYNITVDGIDIKIANGGLHGSINQRIINGRCIDWDYNSMYPNIMTKYNQLPDNIDKRKLTSMITERVINKKKNPQLAQVQKIALNSIYGQMGLEHSPIYNPVKLLNVCITGQLLLLRLFDELLHNGIKIVSLNTDGLLIDCSNGYNEALAEKIFKDDEDKSLLTLGVTNYKLVAIRDVNNYIAMQDNGKVKAKGVYVVSARKKTNSNKAACVNAVLNHLITNESIEDYINNNDDIYDYIIYAKRNKAFTMFIMDDTNEEDIIYKELPYNINRWYNSLDSDVSIVAKKNEGNYNNIADSNNAVLINEVNDNKASSYNINKNYYINESYKLLQDLDGKCYGDRELIDYKENPLLKSIMNKIK